MVVLPTHLPAAPDKNPMLLEKRVYQGSSGKVLQARARLGLGQKPQTKKLLTTVLRRDPNHALAADLNKELF